MHDPFPSPEEIGRLPVAGLDRLLEHLETEVPRRPAWVPLESTAWDRVLVFGDTHGDWRAAEAIARRFEAAGSRTALVGLGDYVDRTPGTLPHGSAINAVFLLSLAARYPDRVFLLQGNHETVRRIGVVPRSLPEDLAGLWGDSEARYLRLVELLERGPYAASTPSGAYLAHGGFPRGVLPRPWTDAFTQIDDQRLEELVWSECAASVIRRGVVPAFTEGELDRFFEQSGLSVFLRGHDPDLAGRPLFRNRCLTLHTTRVYARYGGILLAWVPLRPRLEDLSGVTLEQLPSDPA